MQSIAEVEGAIESLDNSKELSSMESIHTLERMYLQCLDWNENSQDEDVVERSGIHRDFISISHLSSPL